MRHVCVPNREDRVNYYSTLKNVCVPGRVMHLQFKGKADAAVLLSRIHVTVRRFQNPAWNRPTTSLHAKELSAKPFCISKIHVIVHVVRN